MGLISKKATSISPSATLAINAKAKELARKGHKIISFAVGEPDFPTPINIRQAAKKALDEGFTKYTPVSGIPELKEAICQWFKKEKNLLYKPNQVVVSTGGKQALFNALFCLINPGDEVILPKPYWVSYYEMIKLAGGKPVVVPTNKRFILEPQILTKKITKKTKLLILNSPSNPTGAVYSQKELEALAQVSLQKNLWILSDEVYGKIVFDKKKHISIASLSKKIFTKTLVVDAVSKTYSMTGWRLGWVAGSQKIMAACSALQSHITSNPCSIAQKAALEALTGPQDSVKNMVRQFNRRRKALLAGLNKIEGIKTTRPQGAFYVFADIKKTGMKSRKFCEKLLEREKVALVPGIAFGQEGFVRISYATSLENIKEGLRRMKKLLRENLKRDYPSR